MTRRPRPSSRASTFRRERCMRRIGWFALGVVLAACGEDDEGKAGSSGASSQAAAVSACRDFCAELATLASECGYDYRTEFDACYHDLLGCDAAVSIRDEDQFYGECLPGIEQMACEGDLPASCRSQLGF